jgi:hypothetical protein
VFPARPVLYNSRVIKKLLPLALALAAALTMPQAAPAQAVPDERVAAREFAYAAYRLRVKIKAEEPVARRRFAMLESPACRVAAGSEDIDIDRLPRRVQRGFGVVVMELEFGTRFGSIAHHFPGFVAELDRIATADPALVAGREGWRSFAALLAQMAPLPDDTCAQLRRWRRAGFSFDRVPVLQPKPIHDLFLQAARRTAPSDVEPDRSRERAAERMVELGVPQGQATRFVGDTLVRGMPTTIVMGEGTIE